MMNGHEDIPQDVLNCIYEKVCENIVKFQNYDVSFIKHFSNV